MLYSVYVYFYKYTKPRQAIHFYPERYVRITTYAGTCISFKNYPNNFSDFLVMLLLCDVVDHSLPLNFLCLLCTFAQVLLIGFKYFRSVTRIADAVSCTFQGIS